MDIDASTDVTRLELRAASRPRGARPTQAAEFARVYELADARRRRMTGPDRIPEEVWDDISAAGRLADELQAAGRSVRFETHHLTGRIVASLCDGDGNVVHPLPLRRVVTAGLDPANGLDLDPEPAPAA